jgi:hypothetical protein
MPKSSRRHRPKPPPQKDQRGIWRRISPVWKGVIGAVLGVATLLGGYEVVNPAISVDCPSGPVDPLNPYTDSFVVVNNGYLAVHELKVTCIPHVLRAKMLVGGPSAAGPQIQNRAFESAVLSRGERRTFACKVFNFPEPTMRVEYADLGIATTFRPISFIPWRTFRQFVFEATKHQDGTLRWAELSLREVAPTYPPRY